MTKNIISENDIEQAILRYVVSGMERSGFPETTVISQHKKRISGSFLFREWSEADFPKQL